MCRWPEAQATHFTIVLCHNCEFCNPGIAQFEGVTNHCRVELQVAICGLEFIETLHIQNFKSNETCIAHACLLVYTIHVYKKVTCVKKVLQVLKKY